MIVTKNFNTLEFIQPARYGLPSLEYPDDWIHDRLIVLCEVLEILRSKLICPIKIISGYRSKEWNDMHIRAGHNAAIGSMHIQGVAADIMMNGFSSSDMFSELVSMHRTGVVRIGGLGIYKEFVHVDVRYILAGANSGLVIWNG